MIKTNCKVCALFLIVLFVMAMVVSPECKAQPKEIVLGAAISLAAGPVKDMVAPRTISLGLALHSGDTTMASAKTTIRNKAHTLQYVFIISVPPFCV